MFEWALFISIGVAWGGSYLAIQQLVQIMPPFQGAFVRLVLASFFLFVFLFINGVSKKNPLRLFKVPALAVRPVFVAGLFSHGIPFAFLFWGETRVSAAIGGLINGSVPIWAIIVGSLFFREYEKINRQKIIGICVGLTGILFLYLPKLSGGFNAELLGVISITFMAISYGFGTFLNKKIFVLFPKLDLTTNLFYQQLASAFLLLFLMITVSGPPSYATLTSHQAYLPLLYMGLISSALGMLGFYYLLKKWGAVSASSITYIVPVATLFLNFMFYKTIPLLAETVGAILILAGVFLCRRTPSRKIRV